MNHRKPTVEIHELFINRWSSRSFKTDPVPEQTLFRLFEAARWAPSANNLQPWRYILARTEHERQIFHSFINEGNLTWCKNAPVLALLISKTTTADNKPNPAHAFDAGASWGYLALEATHQGLAAHAMGGFNKEAAREALNIPDEYTPQVVIAIGYRDEADKLPEPLKAREVPSERIPLDSIIMDGSFQK